MSLSDLRIERLTIPDVQAAARIIREAGLCSAEDLAERIAAHADAQSSFSYVAKCHGQVIGAALSSFNGFHLFLSHLAVSEEHRGKRVGTRLHMAILDDARRINALAVITDSWLSAAGWYHNHGYRTPGSVFLVREP